MIVRVTMPNVRSTKISAMAEKQAKAQLGKSTKVATP
jgi:hypothetical protein